MHVCPKIFWRRSLWKYVSFIQTNLASKQEMFSPLINYILTQLRKSEFVTVYGPLKRTKILLWGGNEMHNSEWWWIFAMNFVYILPPWSRSYQIRGAQLEKNIMILCSYHLLLIARVTEYTKGLGQPRHHPRA